MLNICTMPEIILVSRNGGTHHEFLGAHKVGCTVPATSKWQVAAKHTSCVFWNHTDFVYTALRRKYTDKFIFIKGLWYGTSLGVHGKGGWSN